MSFLPLLLLSACSDYKLSELPPNDPGLSDPDPLDTGIVTDTATDTAPPPEEACNGVDDDGDGTVDEDFGDVDADGAADCVDDACDVDVFAAAAVERSEVCGGGGTVTDPWETVATSVWSGLATDASVSAVAQTPLVVQLTDDDGDGDVDQDDTLDVVFIAWEGPYAVANTHLVVVDSATWTEVLDLGGIYFAGEVAVGDVDGDGFPDLLAYDSNNALHAWSIDGTELWSTDPVTPYIGGMPAASVADLDGDGMAEVLAQDLVLDGATGAVRATLTGGTTSFSFAQHVPADLDLDGTAEILFAGDVYAADGTLLWSGLSPGVGYLVNGLVVNLDGDPEGEVVMVSDATLAYYDTDGTELLRGATGGGVAAPPCAGDFDGDGAMEIAVPSQSALRVFEADGTEIASVRIRDTSTAAGCVGADLDGDGALEIVYADEEAFYILDARTSTALVTYSEHASGTLFETPSVVDLDGDGATEVLLSSNDNNGRGAWMGITLLEHDGAGWVGGASDWPANARVEGRFGDGGAVVDVGTWWTRSNTFRSVASSSVATPVRDARVEIDDVCYASCDADGVVQVSVRVLNPGATTLSAATEVVLYRVDGGARVEIGRQALGADLASGATAASLLFAVATADVGSEGFVATVGEGAADCHPEDDEDSWSDTVVCP